MTIALVIPLTNHISWVSPNRQEVVILLSDFQMYFNDVWDILGYMYGLSGEQNKSFLLFSLHMCFRYECGKRFKTSITRTISLSLSLSPSSIMQSQLYSYLCLLSVLLLILSWIIKTWLKVMEGLWDFACVRGAPAIKLCLEYLFCQYR